MKRFVIVAVIIVVTALVLGLSAERAPGSTQSITHFLGAPVVSLAEGGWAWLSLGAGTGVLVIGVGGAGLVTFTLAGAGLFFGTGQITAGMMCMGQAGLGIVLFLGQAGTGLVGAGQVVIGLLGWAQGRAAKDGEEFIRKLNDDVNDLLRFR